MQIDYSGECYTGHMWCGISVLYVAAIVLIGQEITIASRPCQTPRVAIDPEDLFADMV
jgi:hypothetical protein